MADTVVDTVLRVRGDTGGAEAALARVSAGMEVVSKRAIPALGRATSVALSQFAAMQTGVSGLGGVFGVFTQALGAISPAMSLVAAGASILAVALLKKRDAVKESTAEITLNITALRDLAEQQDKAGQAARERVQLMVFEKSIALAAAKEKLGSIQADAAATREQQRTADDFAKATYGANVATLEQEGRLGAVAVAKKAAAREAVEFAKAETDATKAADAQLALITQLTEDLAKLTGKTKDQTQADAAAAAAAEKHAAAVASLNDANNNALAAMQVEQLNRQATAQQSILDVERQRAQLRASDAGTDPQAIVAASDLVIAAERQAYQNRRAELSAFTGEREAEDAKYTLFVEQEMLRREKALSDSEKAKAATRKQADAAEVAAHRAKANLIERLGTSHLVALLTLQKVTAGEVIKGVADETKQFLAIKAVQWAAEAIAYAFTPGRQAEAAAKARAAAMAGAGAVAVSAISNAFSAETEAGVGDLTAGGTIGGGGGSTRQGSSRTTVQQGPVTYIINTSMAVYGHVFDMAAIRQLLDSIAMEQSRRAGYSPSVVARG